MVTRAAWQAGSRLEGKSASGSETRKGGCKIKPLYAAEQAAQTSDTQHSQCSHTQTATVPPLSKLPPPPQIKHGGEAEVEIQIFHASFSAKTLCSMEQFNQSVNTAQPPPVTVMAIKPEFTQGDRPQASRAAAFF